MTDEDPNGFDHELNVAIDDSSGTRAEMSENMLILINTNTRSLCPKMNSLIECFAELNVDIGVVT